MQASIINHMTNQNTYETSKVLFLRYWTAKIRTAFSRNMLLTTINAQRRIASFLETSWHTGSWRSQNYRQFRRRSQIYVTNACQQGASMASYVRLSLSFGGQGVYLLGKKHIFSCSLARIMSVVVVIALFFSQRFFFIQHGCAWPIV